MLKFVHSLDVLTGTERIFSNEFTDTFFRRTEHGDYTLLFFLFFLISLQKFEERRIIMTIDQLKCSLPLNYTETSVI